MLTERTNLTFYDAIKCEATHKKTTFKLILYINLNQHVNSNISPKSV